MVRNKDLSCRKQLFVFISPERFSTGKEEFEEIHVIGLITDFKFVGFISKLSLELP
jgi:hypothetical protein